MRSIILFVESRISRGLNSGLALVPHVGPVFKCRDVSEAANNHSVSHALLVVEVRDGDAALQEVLQLRHMDADTPAVLVVSEGSEEFARAAFRAGINDYFHWPEEVSALCESLHRLRISADDRPSPPCEPDACRREFPFVGSSRSMQAIKIQLARIAPSSSNVLITGETGTGKELLACAVHEMSPRAAKPFVRLNCAAIPDSLVESELFGYERGAFTGAHIRTRGWLEAADHGTLFLDEVGDMSPLTQAKFLRVIENKEFHRLGGKSQIKVDVRFVVATNRNLEDMVATNKFRQDLYYRLNIARIDLPPLRDRKEDIAMLLQHYIHEFNNQNRQHKKEITDEVWNCLMSYDWPGNIRELKNVLEASFVNSDHQKIGIDDLPEQFRKRLRSAAPPGADERQQLLGALLHTKWNKSKAAAELRWSRMTLYRKMHKYHIADSSLPKAG